MKKSMILDCQSCTHSMWPSSTESTAKIQMEILNKKRIVGLQMAYTNPIKISCAKSA
jgi:hypothetical protein